MPRPHRRPSCHMGSSVPTTPPVVPGFGPDGHSRTSALQAPASLRLRTRGQATPPAPGSSRGHGSTPRGPPRPQPTVTVPTLLPHSTFALPRRSPGSSRTPCSPTGLASGRELLPDQLKSRPPLRLSDDGGLSSARILATEAREWPRPVAELGTEALCGSSHGRWEAAATAREALHLNWRSRSTAGLRESTWGNGESPTRIEIREDSTVALTHRNVVPVSTGTAVEVDTNLEDNTT
ncbi:hypothetical protein NDU88_001482 [Pleurodeles waltl]|uniref:Uncharacterized protein n=1 Tax=Pleurodeles waltl TaxID=8319 RepID=A0AAV7P7B4_PLEWA|nr:hypothetical protein NDU88_001482 [Pleurodeles waltl]